MSSREFNVRTIAVFVMGYINAQQVYGNAVDAHQNTRVYGKEQMKHIKSHQVDGHRQTGRIKVNKVD